MPPFKPGTIWPSEDEEAEINAAIAADPDTHEATAADIARSRPMLEVFPQLAKTARGRGRPKSDATKANLTLRLDRDIIEHFRATGPGWQTRMNDALREALPKQQVG